MCAQRIIIHGGIFKHEGRSTSAEDYRAALADIVSHCGVVLHTDGARAAVLSAVVDLEDCELFNAGTGSRIQRDGKIRMSASIMDGSQNLFSGVINIQEVRNPILVAAGLASQEHTVLAGDEATRYAHGVGFDRYDPRTDQRLREFEAGISLRTGTVGAVAVDASGCISAATSTGGIGRELPGRASDSATVAGNYAGDNTGISCTGSGEEIVNLAVAASVNARVDVGQTLYEATEAVIEQGRSRGYLFGLIAVDGAGDLVCKQTSGKTLFAYLEQGKVVTFP